MKAEDLLDLIGDVDDRMILEARARGIDEASTQRMPDSAAGKREKRLKWIKWLAAAACFCLIVTAAVRTLIRFDYFGAHCGAMPGVLVDGNYYYNVLHSGVWRYADGQTEKVLSAYWEEDWDVNETGLYYHNWKSVYRVDPETLKKKKLYTVKDGTHLYFDLAGGSDVIVTVCDKHEDWMYQILIDGITGEEKEVLMEKTPFADSYPRYSDLHYLVGDRRIEAVLSEDAPEDWYYTLFENGIPLLPEGTYVDGCCVEVRRGSVISFPLYRDEDTEAEEQVLIFADGTTKIVRFDDYFTGAIGHFLLYTDIENQANDGANGFEYWCMDPDTGETWQLRLDAETDLFEFANDDRMLYSCVPWDDGQSAWEIVYENGKPAALHLLDPDITE